MDSRAAGSTPARRPPVGSRETCEGLRDGELAVVQRPPDARAGEPGDARGAEIVERAHATRHDDIETEGREFCGSRDIGPRELSVAGDFVVNDRADSQPRDARRQLLRGELEELGGPPPAPPPGRDPPSFRGDAHGEAPSAMAGDESPGGATLDRTPPPDHHARGTQRQRRLQLREQLRAYGVECRFQLRRHGLAGAGVLALRIRRPTVHQELVMQVRTGGESGRADVPDRLLLADPLPHVQSLREFREMAVARADAVGVPDLDEIAVDAVAARLGHDAVRGGANRRAVARRVIGALVGSPALEDRMEASTEAARDVAEAQRRPQKGATQRAATIVIETG